MNNASPTRTTLSLTLVASFLLACPGRPPVANVEPTGDWIYQACLEVETRKAAEDGQPDPQQAAHYLCEIEARNCAERRDSELCERAIRRYGLEKRL